MNEKEILEGNKLIAKFMNIFDNRLLINTNENIGSEFIPIISDEENYISKLKFHNDWNWLMYVINKIYSSGLQCVHKTIPVYDTLSSININLTYVAVVEFIKWYNENK